jgi:hypothetical protein
MLKNFKTSELVILALTLIIIFISEYYFVVLGDHNRAIFIGLWPPTMLAFLIYINLKKNK